MNQKSDKFSVHYDRIVNYNLPKASTNIGPTTTINQSTASEPKGKKAMNMTMVFLLVILTALAAIGATWFFTQKGIKADTSVPEHIIMENKATGKVVGRP